MKTVMQEQDSRPEELPLRVQEALGELVGAAKEGLLALSVGVGLGVLSEMMEAELDEVVGPKHATVKGRSAVRHGHENYQQALDGLQLLAGELERSHPGAAASLREGLEETLTLTRLGIRGKLKTTLQSTNPIESMIATVRQTSRNVKRWQSGDMCLRWTAAGMLEAETQFRKIMGYSDLAKLALAVEADLTAQRPPIHTTTNQDAPVAITV